MGFEVPSRTLIVGLGSSGVAAARLALADGSEVWVTDSRPADELSSALETLPEGARTFLGGHPEACLEVDMVVTSPGVPPTAPLLEGARRRELKIISEVEFAWLHRPSAPLVAITGSNGKSTVTALTAAILDAAGASVVAGANLGTPASDLVMQHGWDSWVLEISSFQAETLTSMRPLVAVFLNLSQDHLERHPDLDSYAEAKRRLFAFQKASDAAVLNRDDSASRSTTTEARRLAFSLTDRADGWLDGDTLRLGATAICDRRDTTLSTRHNLANALAAALAARELGASTSAIATALRTFEGLGHRHRTVLSAGGVTWVDDSKATNIGATMAALASYDDGTVHLILGGQGKGQDFSLLAAEVGRSARAVYLIGVDRGIIAEALEGSAPLHDCGTLAEAVHRASRQALSGDTVLLAPACASYDQFTGFAERGDTFTTLAHREAAACP